jgi:hypothetical protein
MVQVNINLEKIKIIEYGNLNTLPKNNKKNENSNPTNWQ